MTFNPAEVNRKQSASFDKSGAEKEDEIAVRGRLSIGGGTVYGIFAIAKNNCFRKTLSNEESPKF